MALHPNEDRDQSEWRAPQEVGSVRSLPGVKENDTIQLQRVEFHGTSPVGLRSGKKSCVIHSPQVIASAIVRVSYGGTPKKDMFVQKIAHMQYEDGRSMYWIFFGMFDDHCKHVYEYDPSGNAEQSVPVEMRGEKTVRESPAARSTPSPVDERIEELNAAITGLAGAEYDD